MKKILSSSKTAIIILIVTFLSLGAYVYMVERPISYGMGYSNETVYDGGSFVGTMKFNSDGTMLNENTNFEEAMESRYYYKDGYVFYLLAESDAEYEDEVASIDRDFDKAIKTPFYADEINAFRLVATEGDGYETDYTCTSAIIFAIAFGALEFILIGLTAVTFIFWKKEKN